MKYPIMYSPAAVRDLDRTWSEVFDASKSVDTADRNVEELMEAVKRHIPAGTEEINKKALEAGKELITPAQAQAFCHHLG